MISQYDESYVFRTSLNSITADFIISTVREQYYKSPLNVVSQPSVEVSMYPANEGERIVEINISYGFSKNVLSSMTVRMDEAAQGIAEYATGSDDFDFLISLCEKLASSASYTVQPVSDLSNTAYGALVSRLATSEGFAMAYKALCDKMGIECIVVNGKHLGDEHFWNIVTFSGSSYHVDVTDYLANNTFLKSDESMRDNYWWDTSTVPACSSDYVHASAAAAYSSN